MPLDGNSPGAIYRHPVDQPLQTDRQSGQRRSPLILLLIKEIYLNRVHLYIVSMYLLGNKSSSITQITETLRCYGAMDYTITVVASSADSAPMQSFAPFAGVAIGEYYRDIGLYHERYP
ncbi:unnamed protein product [Hymenolepis diminuta]|uniref:ATP-synt_ab domain-containing protein n=1 Tax=Hymenolepis diminuta TaxID=6216 RepID=A0A0R3SN94_HYMDI|nr:unnamed protein product [Hymenolepis diminuta]